jgi:hypothetical protein
MKYLLGFHPKPTIHFWEDVRPRSNTCGNILFLPLHMNNKDLDYDTFKNMMDDVNADVYVTTGLHLQLHSVLVIRLLHNHNS